MASRASRSVPRPCWDSAVQCPTLAAPRGSTQPSAMAQRGTRGCRRGIQGGNQEGEPSGDVRGGSKRGTAFCGWAAYPLFRAPFSTGDWSDIRSGRGGGRRSWAQLREAAGRSGVGVAVRRRGPGVGDALHGVGLPRAARGLRRGEVARVWSFGIGETVVRRDVHRGRVWSEQALATADDAHPRRQLRHRGPTQLPEGLIAESHGQGSWQ